MTIPIIHINNLKATTLPVYKHRSNLLPILLPQTFSLEVYTKASLPIGCSLKMKNKGKLYYETD